MEFGKEVKPSLVSIGKPKVSVEIEEILKYESPINFYSVPPTGDLELDEAEHLVNERIRCE